MRELVEFTTDFCNLTQTTMRIASRSFSKEYDRSFLQSLMAKFDCSLSRAVLESDEYAHCSLIRFFLRSLLLSNSTVVPSYCSFRVEALYQLESRSSV